MVKIFVTIGISFALLLLLAVTSLPSHAATIEATVDRTVVQEDESLNLTLSSDSDVDDDPNFKDLERDFRILSRSQSSNISIINGRVNRQIKWELMLMPKRNGDLQIPRIAFGKDRSNAIAIKVSPASAESGAFTDDQVYIEASVDAETVYVQSQIIYTLRIYHSVQLRNASLSELEVSDSDAIIEKLAENRSYEKMIAGRRYRVFEKQFAIFPQNPGQLVIEPAVLEAQFVDLPRVLRTKRVVSKPIKVSVQPVPQQARQAQPAYWLPARSLTLSEEWSNTVNEVKVGDPITRTLTLTASGLMSAQLPVLGNTDAATGIKQYADQPVLDNAIKDSGFIGKRQEKIAYIPTQPGAMQLPAIEVTWWNTNKDQLETVTLPARTIKVVGVAGQESQPSGQSAQADPTSVGQDNVGDVAAIPDTHGEIAGLSSQVWFGISVALLALWLLTVVTWYATSRKRAQPDAIAATTADRDKQSIKAILKQVKSACDSDDPQRVKNALMDWGHEQWPDQPPTSLGHIAQRVNGRLAAELQHLNDLLYKSGGAHWNSDGLWQSLLEYVQTNRKQTTPTTSGIQSLYRIALVNDDQ
ncbi:BatD family protein [Kaarinaea lacus]